MFCMHLYDEDEDGVEAFAIYMSKSNWIKSKSNDVVLSWCDCANYSALRMVLENHNKDNAQQHCNCTMKHDSKLRNFWIELINFISFNLPLIHNFVIEFSNFLRKISSHRIHGRHSMKSYNRLHSAYTIRVQYCQSSKQQKLHSSNAIHQPYHPMWHCSMNSIRPVRCSPFIQRHQFKRPQIQSIQQPRFRPCQAMAMDCCNKISRQNPYSSS